MIIIHLYTGIKMYLYEMADKLEKRQERSSVIFLSSFL